jgi:hypothetical protein
LKVVARFADTWNTYAGWNLSPQQSLDTLIQRSKLLEEYCVNIRRNPDEIIHSFLVGLTADTPFASVQAFHDFVGRYHEIGIDEFIFYYDYPYIPPDKSMNREMLERIPIDAIPMYKSKGAGLP